MSGPLQRRRGVKVRYWKSVVKKNLRGDEVTDPSDGPYETRGWMIPQRSSRAEVPGQQEINVNRIGVDANLDVDLWSRLEINGELWDIVTPPAMRHGTRHVRHQSLDIRRRTAKAVPRG